MQLASLIICVVLAIAHIGAGSAKLVKAPAAVAQVRAGGVRSDRALVVLGVLELAAAVGLVVGLWFTPVGIAAALGSVLYFVGALVGHIRERNNQVQGAVALLLLSIAALVTLLLR